MLTALVVVVVVALALAVVMAVAALLLLVADRRRALPPLSPDDAPVVAGVEHARTQKVVYVVHARASETHAHFATRMHALAAALAADTTTCDGGVSLVVADAPPPRLALFPFVRTPAALLGVYDRSAVARAARVYTPRVRREAAAATRALAAFAVDESVPLRYRRTWRAGVATPWPCLLTLLRRRRALDDASYLRRWHHGHTPLSLDVHPLRYYQRNVVRARLVVDDGDDDNDDDDDNNNNNSSHNHNNSDNHNHNHNHNHHSAAACAVVSASTHAVGPSDGADGIVVECCTSRAAMMNPLRFYGGRTRAQSPLRNIARVLWDLLAFLELNECQTFLATEFLYGEHHVCAREPASVDVDDNDNAR